MDKITVLKKMKEKWGKDPFIKNGEVTMVNLDFLYFVTECHLQAEKILNDKLLKLKEIANCETKTELENAVGKEIASVL